MTFNVEIRSPDYTGSGTARTTTSTTQSDITKIVLPVTQIQYTTNKTVDVAERMGNPDPHLQANGGGTKSVTLSGVFTTTTISGIDPAYLADDLRYAVDYWYDNSAGTLAVSTLVWTEAKVVADTDKTFTLEGVLQRCNFERVAGQDSAWNFSVVFLIGAVES